MKKLLILLLSGVTISMYAQKATVDTISISDKVFIEQADGYFHVRVDEETIHNSPHVDVAKSLYGKAAGLNVFQGTGSSASNVSSLSLHGHRPLIVVDGYIRDLVNIVPSEIESVTLLKDAASAALYGVRGGNGIVFVKTKRGREQGLHITANYQIGMNTQFRSPVFANSYDYALSLNEALRMDGLSPKYGEQELDAFRTGKYPYAYPNVDWWNEVYNNLALNHRLDLTFEGGNKRFRYYVVADYMHDTGFLKKLSDDKRYYGRFTDSRLGIRGNIDAKISRSTDFKLGLVGKISEDNQPAFGDFYNILYRTPASAFPIRHEDGIYGGSLIYGADNPYALVASTGNHRNTYATMLADADLIQGLDFIAKGLSAELGVSFDYFGKMYDKSAKTYRYEELVPSFESGTLVTMPHYYGKDSETLNHSHGVMSIYMRTMFQGRLKYHLDINRHVFDIAAVYDQQAYISSGRNKSAKRQAIMLSAAYNYDNRYIISSVSSWSGTAYLPEGSRFKIYPAVSAQWNIHNENFMKGSAFSDFSIYASYGLSGWDGNLSHELYLQNYGAGNNYYFTNNATSFGGMTEGKLPVENLKAELAEKVSGGLNIGVFDNRLCMNVEGFYEKRSDILVASSSTSGIIGVEVGSQNAGIQEYFGFDASLGWKDTQGDFRYGIQGNVSYVNSKIIEDNQAFQEYDYLYHKGNRVGQQYGLEATGLFQNWIDINNSPQQRFGDVRPGDIKYKDQNGDNVIDEKDIVKMFGSTIPRFYFGVNINFGYKGFDLSATFQGLAGRTVNLLDSPLYKPTVNYGNMSKWFMDNEVAWTPERAGEATMPRLTTIDNKNNYRNSSWWYRDGSFIKLRDLTLSYTFPKAMTRFADVKIYLQGTNLFSLDNIDFADPEQLGAAYPATRTYWVGLKFNF